MSGPAFTTGKGFTVTVEDKTAEQPCVVSVPVIVKFEVEAGVTTMVLVVAEVLQR